MTAHGTLNGKTALVTGGARRLGRHIAEGLARQGCDVVVHYLSSETEASETVEVLRKTGVSAWKVRADLHDSVESSGLVARAMECCGKPLDILVNNASVFPSSTLDDFDEADLLRNVRVNALSPALSTRAFAAAATEGACIINLLDSRITDYDRNHVSYHLSKRMLFSLTRMMAIEYAPTVRVNAVAPGLILPPEGEDESYLASLASTNPLQTYGGSEDIVAAVRYLATAPFVTGQVLYVDGGRHLKGNMYGA